MRQLMLWPDDDGRIDVQCDHCGWTFDARPQLERRQANLEARVLAHPRVKALPSRTRAFLAAALPAFYAAQVA
jgi:hypothetical protein